MGLKTLLSLLLLWLSFQACVGSQFCPSPPDTCTRKLFIEADNTAAFCITQATLHHAHALLVFGNGSCLLLGVCGTVSGSEPPLFRLARPGQQLPLLKIRAGINGSPLTLLENGEEHMCQFEQFDQITSDPYKSPLLSVYPAPFSHVSLVLTDLEDDLEDLEVNLTFTTSAERIQEASWFSRSSLVAYSPWDLKDVKSNDTQFWRNKRCIMNNQKLCEFVISKQDRVTFEFDKLDGLTSPDEFFMAVVYLSDNNEYIYRKNANQGVEDPEQFRLYGTLHNLNEVRFYFRLP